MCRNFGCSVLSSALINQRGHSREEKAGEEDDLPRYRDRAKERREDVNPDYEATTAELGSLHAVAPPGTVDLRYHFLLVLMLVDACQHQQLLLSLISSFLVFMGHCLKF